MKILFNRHTLQTLPFWLLSALGTLSGPAATITWNGGGGDTNWSTAGNWNGATPANGDTLVFSGSTRQTNTNNWLATLGAVTFTTGGFAIGGNAVTLNGDLTSTGNNTWNLATTLGSARIFTSQSGTLTLGGTITNAGYLTTIAGAGNTLISSAIGGTGGLAKTGAGTLTLSNSGNTYSGATSITGGILAISADSQLGTAPGTFTQGQLVLDSGTLSSTGTFSLDPNRGIQIGPFSGQGDGTINVGSGELTYNGIIASNGVSGTGNLVKSGAGTLTLGGANTYSGNTTISAGILKLASSTAIPSGVGNGNLTITSPGSLDINGNSLNLNGMTGTGTITSGIAGAATLTVGGNATTSTFGGVIQNGSGTLGLAKTGTGSFTLSGNNTFTGGLTINAGTVTLGSVGALNSTTPNSVTFGTSAPATTKLQIGGNNVTIASLATATIPGTAVVENASATAATLTVNQAIDTTFAGVLQNGTGGGTLGLTKGGAGTLTLSGTNTLTGLITINAGTVALSGGAAVPDTGAITFANTAGANLQLNASETVGSIAGGGSTGGNVLLQSFTLTTGGASTDTTYGGVISGTGNLIKTGTANMFLTRISTYSGNTTVKNGQLVLLNIDNALPQTTVLTLGDGTTNTSGVFRLNAQIQTLAGLTTAGTGTGNRVINGSATTKNFTLNIATTDTVAGILGGSTSDENNLNLIKSGSGTLTLTGTNTFSYHLHQCRHCERRQPCHQSGIRIIRHRLRRRCAGLHRRHRQLHPRIHTHHRRRGNRHRHRRTNRHAQYRQCGYRRNRQFHRRRCGQHHHQQQHHRCIGRHPQQNRHRHAHPGGSQQLRWGHQPQKRHHHAGREQRGEPRRCRHFGGCHIKHQRRAETQWLQPNRPQHCHCWNWNRQPPDWWQRHPQHAHHQQYQLQHLRRHPRRHRNQ